MNTLTHSQATTDSTPMAHFEAGWAIARAELALLDEDVEHLRAERAAMQSRADVRHPEPGPAARWLPIVAAALAAGAAAGAGATLASHAPRHPFGLGLLAFFAATVVLLSDVALAADPTTAGDGSKVGTITPAVVAGLGGVLAALFGLELSTAASWSAFGTVLSDSIRPLLGGLVAGIGLYAITATREAYHSRRHALAREQARAFERVASCTAELERLQERRDELVAALRDSASAGWRAATSRPSVAHGVETAHA